MMMTNRKLLLSAAAVVALTGAYGHLTPKAWALDDDRMAGSARTSTLSVKPGEVSSDPLAGPVSSSSEEGFVESTLIEIPESVSSIDQLAEIAPASGSPAPSPAPAPEPTVLGGSDQDPIVPPTPVSVEPMPAPSPEPSVAVIEPAPAPIEPAPIEPAPAPEQAAAPAPTPEPVVVTNMPTPDAVLAAPAATNAPVNAVMDGPLMPEAVTGNVASDKIVAEKPDGPDTYYDSRINVPTGPMADKIGPRKVDPNQEPATKLVVAKKTHNAGEQEALLASANRALELDRYDAALDLFDRLYAKNKRDPRILMGRAIAQQKTGKTDVAIMTYEELLKIQPNNTEAIVNMMGLIQSTYPEVALRRLSDLQLKYPNNDVIVAQLGMAFANSGSTNEAIRALTTAASINPHNAQHLYNIAVVSDRAGNKTQAIKYYEDALQTDAVYGESKSVPREQIYDRLSRLRQ